MPLINTDMSFGDFTPFDDSVAELGRNGKPALAELIRMYTNALNSINHAGRPIFHWWGGGPHNASLDPGMFQTLWQGYFKADRYLRGRALILEPDQARDATQGIRVEVGAPLIATPGTEYDYPREYELSAAASTSVDPTNLKEVPFGADIELASFVPRELLIGTRADSTPAAAPALASGVLYCPRQIIGDPSNTYSWIPPNLAVAGHDIPYVGATGDTKTLAQLQSMLFHAWMVNRPHFAWSALNLGSDINYVDFSNTGGDIDSYRYIFDRTIGTGGTAPSATGPGITLPLYKAAAGIRTTIRVYVYVYARRSGGANTGSIAVANKANSFAMTALTNPETINSTTWQWWPDISAQPPGAVSSAPYFDADCSEAFDRVVLSGKMSGDDGGKLQVAGFVLIPHHAA